MDYLELDGRPLETACPKCDGKRALPHDTLGSRPCQTCSGTGLALTPLGETIVKLVQRHLMAGATRQIGLARMTPTVTNRMRVVKA